MSGGSLGRTEGNCEAAAPAGRPLSPRLAHALREAPPSQERLPRDAAEVGDRYARRDAERRAGKARAA